MNQSPVKLITTAPALEEVIRAITKASVIGVDTETTGLDPFTSEVRLAQIATDEQTFVIDLFEIDAFNDPHLRQFFSQPHPIKIFHNAKFDLKMLLHHFNLEAYGIFDTMLASQLISAGRSEGGNSLAAVVSRYLNQELDKSLQVSDWSGKLTDAQYEYAAKDVTILLPLRERMTQELVKLHMVEVAKLEFDCVLPVAAMEIAGMYLSADCWRKQVESVEREHAAISSDLKRELASGIEQLSLFDEPTINLDSPSQVTDALARMGIKVEGTRSWQLQPLVKEHPVIEKLLAYRHVQKALSSYGLNFLTHIHAATGRIHSDFRQIGAAGGRMSCSEPNLQQVPNTKEYRSCFRAPAGRKLIIADYSQIELRILADWSQDTALVKALMSGEDLHRVTASQMFNVPLDGVTKEQRAAAKQLNYGIMYGLGASGLAARIDCSNGEAENLIKKYFAAYKGVDGFLREAANRAVQEHESRTRSGRLVTFNFDPNDRSQVAATQRYGKNAPVQGSSADITKRALTLIYEALKPFDAKIVNCIHDEIVIEAAENQAQEGAKVLEQTMVQAAREYIRSVPVTVDIAIADAWLK
ncbi:MAG: bifunctional 3'-5' exonuclease/DNA polymerase [Acidobacteriota bacterium]